VRAVIEGGMSALGPLADINRSELLRPLQPPEQTSLSYKQKLARLKTTSGFRRDSEKALWNIGVLLRQKGRHLRACPPPSKSVIRYSYNVKISDVQVGESHVLQEHAVICIDRNDRIVARCSRRCQRRCRICK